MNGYGTAAVNFLPLNPKVRANDAADRTRSGKVSLYFGLLKEEAQQTNNHSEEGHTLDKRCDDNHVGADIRGCFGLTGDGLHSRTTNTTNTKASTNGGNTSTDSSTQFCGCSSFK